MAYVGIGMIFLFALFLQGSIIALPLLLPILLLFYIYYRALWVFLIAFFAGIFLDVVLVYPVGASSLFFLSFLFLIFLYQRKFEIGSYYFIFFSLFIGIICYAWVFGIGSGVFMAFLLAILGASGFYIISEGAHP